MVESGPWWLEEEPQLCTGSLCVKLQLYFCKKFPISICLSIQTQELIDNILSLLPSDTICDLGGVNELANYGEYSGAPSEQQTYDYAKTILSLMTREKHPDGELCKVFFQSFWFVVISYF